MLLADSGVLLICYTDRSGQLQDIRKRFHTAFPGTRALTSIGKAAGADEPDQRSLRTGSPSKQTTIIHTSLLRILTPEQLSSERREAISAHCAQLTAKLRGRRLACRRLWYIAPEETYATVQGQTQEYSFALK